MKREDLIAMRDMCIIRASEALGKGNMHYWYLYNLERFSWQDKLDQLCSTLTNIE